MELSSDPNANQCIFIAIIAGIQFISAGLQNLIGKPKSRTECGNTRRKHKKGDKQGVNRGFKNGKYEWAYFEFVKYDEDGQEVWRQISKL